MIEKYPNFLRFNQLYWHQMGDELYGSIENAFREMLKDASKLPDGGNNLRNDLNKELKDLTRSGKYGEWLSDNETNKDTIDTIGGMFILERDLTTLTRVLEENATRT